MKNLKTEITKIHYNKDAHGALVKFLEFASIFYGIGSGLKNFFYDKNILKPKKVDAYVVSVGNITTGGVGKTPVVSEIAKYYLAKDEKTAIISRGYGGKLSNKQINLISDGEKIYYNANLAGDEPFWLAENTLRHEILRLKPPNDSNSTEYLSGAIVITSKNRYAAAKYAIENFGVTKIILDDGFQHRKLHRDLDIVLSDSEKGFGNEKLLPAGPLREGTEAFKRIDRMVVVSKNVDHTRAEKIAKITQKRMKIPTFLCKTEPDYIYNIKTLERLNTEEEFTAICAIGQPGQFFDFLKDFRVKEMIPFDDHHQYELKDIENITGKIVTTEKDAVKLQQFDNDNIYALKLKITLDVEGLLNGKTEIKNSCKNSKDR